MGTFAFIASMLGFTDGKKILGCSEERSWPEVNVLAPFRWLLRHRMKIERSPMKDFPAHYCQLGGRKSVLVPAAASFKEPW